MIEIMSLAEAAARIGVSVNALRSEYRKGRLTVRQIGKNYYVTPDDLTRMVERCRVPESQLASSSETDTGSSATDSDTSELDALKASMAKLSSSSADTSTGGRRKRQGKVVDLKTSASRKS